MNRKRKSGRERKAEIVEAALQLMAEVGTANVTAQAIADRIGIAQPTIFRHFATRNAIFQAALKFVAEQILSLIAVSHRTGTTPADERLHGLLKRQLSIVSRNPGLPRMLFSDRLHQEDPGLKESVRGVMDRYVAYVEAIIADGQRTSLFRSNVPPRTAAIYVAAIVQGLLVRWSVHDFAFPLEDEIEPLWSFIYSALTEPGQSALTPLSGVRK